MLEATGRNFKKGGKMNRERGKITFMNLLVFVILVFGGFMAFKYIATGVEKKQIKIEVFDTLGSTRGGDPENSQIVATIERVLEKKKVEILEVAADLDRSKSIIYYSFKYRIVTNYVLFKRSEIIEVVDEIANYGG
jgi:hypothetical protein